jgi:hypothetical protein
MSAGDGMTLLNVPALRLEMVLDDGHILAEQMEGERRIVSNLFQHLAASGWEVAQVWDSETFIDTPTQEAAMEVIFSLEGARVFFKSKELRRHSVVLAPGLDTNIVCNFSSRPGDPDGFKAAMNKFDLKAFVDDAARGDAAGIR